MAFVVIYPCLSRTSHHALSLFLVVVGPQASANRDLPLQPVSGCLKWRICVKNLNGRSFQMLAVRFSHLWVHSILDLRATNGHDVGYWHLFGTFLRGNSARFGAAVRCSCQLA
mmetsp:Transcript_73690/g.146540  ORF Transcript_73690/g.146540 Transcript_73690/m.146540 type:complete len:113 (+) Transcript_73690:2113-2451(+)